MPLIFICIRPEELIKQNHKAAKDKLKQKKAAGGAPKAQVWQIFRGFLLANVSLVS